MSDYATGGTIQPCTQDDDCIPVLIDCGYVLPERLVREYGCAWFPENLDD
ncbi:hypothetical protein AB0383_20555 [Amycolatopsis sp. NPDC051373]